MELEHKFTVPVPVDQAWEVLLDVERIAPCMPGATLDGIDGDAFTGKVKVKVGPITVAYAGKASFLEKDAAAHRAVIEAKGRETRGQGTAAATVRASMADEGGSTRVTVLTDLAITGKPAQFGRGIMNDVGNKLIGQFADCLAATITADASGGRDSQAADEPAAGDAAKGERPSRPTPDAIDLCAVAGGSVAKRLGPVAAVLAVLLVAWILVRRRKR